ncbi:MAG: czcD [Gammaproteobacteria bacterium]|jgi:cobalt-zinc-cadmium efflux system protein|nr:czcD [Gammaproteobacteria bacterium]MCE3237547.1 czcD [Gammaproteobacteria bacterium]
MSHGHTHHHSSNMTFAIAVLLNLGLTVFQFIYAFLANSMSLMADATHNFGDVLGLILAWGANWLMLLPARKRYSYGYKKTTVLAALANAFILVVTTTLIIYGSIFKFLHPNQINAPIVIILALIGILINGGTALLFMKGAHEDLNIKGAFLHLVGDAVISMGVVVSAILILYTHWLWLDPVIGLCIAMIILWGTWGLLRDSVRLMMDAVPRHINYAHIQKFLQTLPGVEAVHDLHIWGLSTKEVALTAHLIMPNSSLSDADYQKINTVLKDEFQVNHATLQVETGNLHYPCGRRESC